MSLVDEWRWNSWKFSMITWKILNYCKLSMVIWKILNHGKLFLVQHASYSFCIVWFQLWKMCLVKISVCLLELDTYKLFNTSIQYAQQWTKINSREHISFASIHYLSRNKRNILWKRKSINMKILPQNWFKSNCSLAQEIQLLN